MTNPKQWKSIRKLVCQTDAYRRKISAFISHGDLKSQVYSCVCVWLYGRNTPRVWSWNKSPGKRRFGRVHKRSKPFGNNYRQHLFDKRGLNSRQRREDNLISVTFNSIDFRLHMWNGEWAARSEKETWRTTIKAIIVADQDERTTTWHLSRKGGDFLRLSPSRPFFEWTLTRIKNRNVIRARKVGKGIIYQV